VDQAITAWQVWFEIDNKRWSSPFELLSKGACLFSDISAFIGWNPPLETTWPAGVNTTPATQD